MPLYICQKCGIGKTMNKNIAICSNPKCRTPNPTWVEWLPKSQQPTGQLPQIKAVQVDSSVFVNELNKLKATLPGNIHVDPIAKNIQSIIGKLDPGHKIDAQLILNMFFFLHHNAKSLMTIVETKCKVKVDKSTFFAALAQVFSGREIVPGEELLLVNNEILHGHFLQAWCEVKEKWPKDSEDQVKFVKDIFISQKGYAKTARSLESWTPPSKVNLAALLSSWLTRSSNVSIFTKLTVQTETARINSTRSQNDQIQAPGTIAQQIAAWYAEESKVDVKYNQMWGGVLLEIHNAYGFAIGAAHKKSLCDIVMKKQADIKLGLQKSFSGQEVNRFIWERLNQVYKATFEFD